MSAQTKRARGSRALRSVLLTITALSAVGLAGCGGGGGYDGGQVNNPPPAPTVTLNAPSGGSVHRTTTLTANAAASAGVTRVEFLVDGTVVGSATSSPYTFDWDTSAVADGAHTLTARVTDAAGVVVTSAPVDVTVNNNPTIPVALSPEETFPRPNSTASGSGELTFNLITGAVSGAVEVVGVDATLAHIHQGYAGTSGPVAVAFVQSSADPNRWEPQADAMLTAEQIDALLLGKLYVNVHSAAYPQGEIRGQVQPENIDVAITPLDGASVSPPVTTTASGLAAATLDASGGTATIHVNAAGVDDATEAHVHKAAAGANDATAFITLAQDPAALGHWSAELEPITSADRTDFDANEWYADVHTPANPDGELRGQFTPNTTPPPSATTLSQLQSSIFTPICAACHNGSGGGSLPGSMNLSSATSSYAALVGVPSEQQPSLLRVAANNPDDSYLVRKLEGGPGISGARMPLGGPFLDQATIDQVRSWISAGAQND